MSGGKPKVTSSDRETARQLCEALVVTRRTANVEEVARILAFIRDQTISCALVDVRRERERETAGHAAWCRTDGCGGECRQLTVDSEQSEEAKQLSTRELRRGLLGELRAAFELAIAMCGSFHPDEIEPEQKRLRALREEVVRLLRAKQKKGDL